MNRTVKKVSSRPNPSGYTASQARLTDKTKKKTDATVPATKSLLPRTVQVSEVARAGISRMASVSVPQPSMAALMVPQPSGGPLSPVAVSLVGQQQASQVFRLLDDISKNVSMIHDFPEDENLQARLAKSLVDKMVSHLQDSTSVKTVLSKLQELTATLEKSAATPAEVERLQLAVAEKEAHVVDLVEEVARLSTENDQLKSDSSSIQLTVSTLEEKLEDTRSALSEVSQLSEGRFHWCREKMKSLELKLLNWLSQVSDSFSRRDAALQDLREHAANLTVAVAGLETALLSQVQLNSSRLLPDVERQQHCDRTVTRIKAEYDSYCLELGFPGEGRHLFSSLQAELQADGLKAQLNSNEVSSFRLQLTDAFLNAMQHFRSSSSSSSAVFSQSGDSTDDSALQYSAAQQTPSSKVSRRRPKDLMLGHSTPVATHRRSKTWTPEGVAAVTRSLASVVSEQEEDEEAESEEGHQQQLQ